MPAYDRTGSMITDPGRFRVYGQEPRAEGPVLYWMHRNFRARDNWALIHAREEALKRQAPVVVAFCLAPAFLDATLRQYDFLLKGLEETSAALLAENIAFLVRIGDPESAIHRLIDDIRPSLIVTDFDPLRIKRQWLQSLLKRLAAPIHEVDARNIVPCWLASDHREFMARTIRPKIHLQLDRFLAPFPAMQPHPFLWENREPAHDFRSLLRSLRVDCRVAPVSAVQPGETAAFQVLAEFLERRLGTYGELRNDPNHDACSRLSPYLHFGMISSQRIVLEIRRRGYAGKDVEAFLEELVVRRELADNFCLYCRAYDSEEGFPEWARQSLAGHIADPRPYLYDEETLERGETHDRLWNAAQRQMLVTGKMHGYMRMYWAKKILEWTQTPAQALRIAIRLNDRYSLDGRDSNGYAGIAWSIGGVHDRGWPERPIFGKIRYMNDRGMARKFAVEPYIRSWTRERKGSFPG